jgi:phosphoesterase RecJ-like protein
MHVDQAMIDASGASDEDTEGFIDVSRSVQGVEIVVFIRPESDGRWKVSFRGKEGRDVGAIAVELGGGGHRYASGSAVSGSLEEVYAKIRSVIDTRFL